jgi:hypothetical protein
MARTPSIPASDKTTAEAQTSASTRRVAQLTGHLAPAEEIEQANSRPVLPIEYPLSKLQLDPGRYIDDLRKLRVAVIGAGLAGINAGILLPAKVPGIELTIFEKNKDVASITATCLLRDLTVAQSGTWLENVCRFILLLTSFEAHKYILT